MMLQAPKYGENFFTVAPTHSRHVSVLSRAPVSSATQPGSATSVWASGAPPSVLNIEPQPANNKDPFLSTNAHWPLDGHYQIVYNVSGDMKKQDPHIFTPLLTAQDRYKALQNFRGKCLSCLEAGHSLRTCNRHFLNKSHLLNPAIGDDNTLWTRWQKRMASTLSLIHI